MNRVDPAAGHIAARFPVTETDACEQPANGTLPEPENAHELAMVRILDSLATEGMYEVFPRRLYSMSTSNAK